MNRRAHDQHPQRQEPFLGDPADVQVSDHVRPWHARVRRVSDHRLRNGLLAGLALLVLLVVVFRGFLGDIIMPPTRAQALVEQGGQALAVGRLTATDGSGARELYEAAIAIDPDRPEARAGLAAVAAEALRQARVAAQEDRFADAHTALRLSRELAVPRDQADAVAALLRQRESAHAGIDVLVAQAEQARLAGHLDGDDTAALPLFARVLALQPGHADALGGREDALGTLLEAARERLRAGDVASAAAAIATAGRYDPGHADLPDAQARLTEELDALRRRADAELSRGRIEGAVAGWRKVLELEPEDAGALAGLRRAAEAQAARARRLAADFRFADADAALRAAIALAPDSDAVREASAQVERSRQAHRARTPSLPAADRQRRVAGLLQQAAAAEARGDLLTPPGESAYDRLRAAQALAPGDAAVRQAASRLLPMARQCFDDGLGANDLGRARNCLDMRASLGEDDADIARARRRLAQRWLAIGDERLGAGQVDGARVALRHAQQFDPAAPGIDQLRARLQTAMPVTVD